MGRILAWAALMLIVCLYPNHAEAWPGEVISPLRS